MHRVHSIDNPDALQAIANPIRIKVLESLREPASAAIVAREIGLPRQKVNYHLKELLRVGLVLHAGERRKGNFLEQLYQAVASRFVISPAVSWNPEKLAATLREQTALAHLADLGERLQRDATALLDRAAYDGEHIPSTTIETELHFEDMAARQRFMTEYMTALKPLLERWATPGGDRYKLSIAIYPDAKNEEETK